MKRIVLAVLALLALGLAVANAVPNPAKKQMVCHRDTLIYVGNPAVKAHLKHGDCLIDSEDITLVGQPCSTVDADGDSRCDAQR
jgi:hypothetical protein